MKLRQCSFYVEGLNLERFIGQAAELHIELNHMRRIGARKLYAQADEHAVQKIMELADDGGWRYVPHRFLKLSRALAWMRSHLLCCALALIVFICIIFASRLIWFVQIENAGIYEPDIRSYLQEQQIGSFRWKQEVDTGLLQEQLTMRYPQIAWIECGWRGTTLCITVREGEIYTGEVNVSDEGDVIASRSGIVDRMVVLAGTPAVSPGDIVQKGDVLIRGAERTEKDTYRSITAKGAVFARVWDGASVRVPYNIIETEYTGQVTISTAISTPWFDLWQTPKEIYEHEDVSVQSVPIGGLYIPLWRITRTHMEAEPVLRRRDEAAVKREAEAAAMRILQQKTGTSHELVDKWIEFSMIDDEVLEAVAICERIIDIADHR